MMIQKSVETQWNYSNKTAKIRQKSAFYRGVKLTKDGEDGDDTEVNVEEHEVTQQRIFLRVETNDQISAAQNINNERRLQQNWALARSY